MEDEEQHGEGQLARASFSSHQAEVRAKERQALADELAQAEVEANKRLHDEGQKYTTLLAKVVPLHAEIATLKDVAAANQAKMTSLEERSVTQEVLLGKVEADLAGKNEALEKIKAELAEQAKLLEKSKKELAERTESLVKV
ncbi:uncharacterized protein [Phaseolus vulgaris]|uniref:uncharacterized protein n=1 Tax=Phaseolus vulgaris TaxID=3885 RepID=UPI0035CAC872